MSAAPAYDPLMLNQTVYLALSAALDLKSDHWKTPFRVRQALVNPSPPPPPEDQDVLYYHLVPEPSAPLTEASLSADGKPCAFRFAEYRLNLTIYGPHAEVLAWQVFHRLYLDGSGNARRILRLNGIYPVPRPQAPALIWEEWEKQHRPRADLVILLWIASNETLSNADDSIAVSPDIQLHTQERSLTL